MVTDNERIAEYLEQHGSITSCPSGVTGKVPATDTKIAPASDELRGRGQRGISSMSKVSVEPGYCQCGCGAYVGFWERNHRDQIKGNPKSFRKGHQNRVNKRPLAERFWERVDVAGPDDCWEWKLSCFESGYGQWKVKPKNLRVHRVAYELSKGEIPDGLYVCHTCDNPPCCNPNHLWLGSNTDNQRDCIEKGRKVSPTGEGHGMAKLTAENVASIRAAHPRNTTRSLALRFDVSQSQIRRIVTRTNWSES
jgi:hypothetical protein